MRAWWSVLFVPQRRTHLQRSCDCSLLCLEEPTTKSASGPLSLRIATSLLAISSYAWSQLIFCHLPGELHRVAQAVRIVGHAVLAHRGAFRAMRAEVERRVEHRFLADPDAVLHHSVDRAADRAVRAHRALHLELALFCLRL